MTITAEQIAALQPFYEQKCIMPYNMVEPDNTNWDEEYDIPGLYLTCWFPADAVGKIMPALRHDHTIIFGKVFNEDWGDRTTLVGAKKYRGAVKEYKYNTKAEAEAAIADDINYITETIAKIFRLKNERLALRAQRINNWLQE